MSCAVEYSPFCTVNVWYILGSCYQGHSKLVAYNHQLLRWGSSLSLSSLVAKASGMEVPTVVKVL